MNAVYTETESYDPTTRRRPHHGVSGSAGRRLRGVPSGAFLLLLLPCLLVACGGANPTTTATAHASATASRTPTPAASPPPGGPAPVQLIADWELTPFASNPNNAVDLIVNATTFSFETSGDTNFGDLVVNGTEIDFYNGDGCGLALPDGVGRYRWSLQGAALSFAPLAQDPCGMRSTHLSNQIYAKR
jgi:hypothetical protein